MRKSGVMVFKKKYKILLFGVLPIILLSVMHKLVGSIIKSDKIYDEILDEGNITRSDAEELAMYSSVLLHVPQDYGSLFLVFDRRGNRESENKTAQFGQNMGPFF